jgi:hypothetical protein
MSQYTSGYPATTAGASPSEQPTSQVARDEAGATARTAADAGRQVAGTAAEQAKTVAQEATAQARDLAGEARGQVQQQARNGQQKATDGIHALSAELREMAGHDQKTGKELPDDRTPRPDLTTRASLTTGCAAKRRRCGPTHYQRGRKTDQRFYAPSTLAKRRETRRCACTAGHVRRVEAQASVLRADPGVPVEKRFQGPSGHVFEPRPPHRPRRGRRDLDHRSTIGFDTRPSQGIHVKRSPDRAGRASRGGVTRDHHR